MSILKDLLKDLEKYEENLDNVYEYKALVNYCQDRCILGDLSEEFKINFFDWTHTSGISSGYITTGYEGAHNREHLIKMSDTRCISWEDNGKVPEEGEWLYKISFSTGAYMFGRHYPYKLFNEFFKELKALNPKYCDTKNSALYFSSENACYARSEFFRILEKYSQLSKKEGVRFKMEKLEKELEVMKNEMNKT